MSIEEVLEILCEDAERSSRRSAEAAAMGHPEDAALYAGKKLEANRVIGLIEMRRQEEADLPF